MQISIEELISRVLRIPQSEVTTGLSFQDIPEWDSLQHVQIMVALEEHVGIPINGEAVAQLTSVASIKSFVDHVERTGSSPGPEWLQERAVIDDDADADSQAKSLSRGLKEVHIDFTSISSLDATSGTLAYRGRSLETLVDTSFEEVAYLLLFNRFADASGLDEFSAKLTERRNLSTTQIGTLSALTQLSPISFLQTGCQLLECERLSQSDAALKLIAAFPSLLCLQVAAARGASYVPPDNSFSHAENLCHMLGHEPTPALCKLVDMDLVLHAEHECNASTFTARIATSAGANPYSAVSAALSTFGGALHGGAIDDVATLANFVSDQSKVAQYVSARLEKGQSIPGFGHSVYRFEDPRVKFYRRMVDQLADMGYESKLLPLVIELEKTMTRYARLGLHSNVDLYAAVFYEMLGLPEGFGSALFACGRIVGWLAHIEEQRHSSILIRPRLLYRQACGQEQLV
jgi:citrate synthase